MPNSPGYKFMAIAASAMSFCAAASASDVSAYTVFKGQTFYQTNSGNPVAIPAKNPHRFLSFVSSSAPDSLTNASLRLPNLSTRPLTNIEDSYFEFSRSFTNKTLLDTAFPAGSYRFILNTVNDGKRTPTLTLAPDNYPSVPRVLNWSDLSAVEAGQPLTLDWSPFAKGAAKDFILFEIVDANDVTAFSTPELLEPNALNGTNTTLTIPASQLQPNQSYTGRLLFVRRVGLNLTNYADAVGYVGYFRQTEFPILTLDTPPAAGRFQFSTSAYRTSETNGSAFITITRSGSEGDASVDFTANSGTATANQDFAAGTTTVGFSAGETSKEVFVPILDDYRRETNETVLLSLSSPTGGAVLGPRSSAVLTIADNEIASAGTFQFSARGYSLSETGGVAKLNVIRTGGTSGNVSVSFQTAEVSAAVGDDFIGTNGVVTFLTGQTNKVISIRVLNDSLDETNEAFQVVLTSCTGGGSLGANSTAKVNIIDDDSGGKISFSAAAYRAGENAGSAEITVSRAGGRASGVSVDFSTSDDTASAGSDYVATNGTLSFGVNELSKKITIPINQDDLAEGNERLLITLSNPTGGATLNVTNQVPLVIVDDESSISFAKSAYAVTENAKSLTLTLTRSGALNTPASIDFATVAGSATQGSDYTATNGTVKFATNVVSRTITIPISNDYVVEDAESFEVILSNPKNTALGTAASSTVSITDDDFPGTIAFSSATYSVGEGTNATIVVKRTGGLASGVTVHLDAIAGTATTGTDFTALSTNLVFAGGESSKTVRIKTVLDNTIEGTETVKLSLSSVTGGAALGTITNATLSILNRPDPNAIPAAGESYLIATITGIEGNSVSKTLNVTYNPAAQEIVSGSYVKSLGLIQGLTGSKTTITLSGFTPITTSHMLQFPSLKALTPGIVSIDPTSSQGGAVWTYSVFGSPAQSYAYGTGRTGSSGSVIIDVLDTKSKIIAGRFNFVAVQDGGSKKVRISGSFRVKNATVN